MGIGECTFFRTGGGGGGPVPFLSPFLGHTPKPGDREAKEGVLLPSEEGKGEEKREKVLHMFAQKIEVRGVGGGRELVAVGEAEKRACPNAEYVRAGRRRNGHNEGEMGAF